MKKEVWEQMSDEQKTSYMRKVFKELDLGETFDYKALKERHKQLEDSKVLKGTFAYKNPMLELELVDPIMADTVLGWMYSKFDTEGNYDSVFGEPAPIFGYNMVTLWFDKKSLMQFNDDERDVIKRAMNILKDRVVNNEQEEV